MIKRITFLAICTLLISIQGFAQLCGFDNVHQTALQNNTVYAQKMQMLKADINNYFQQMNNSNALIVNTANGPVYQIPIVIHVIHTGGAVGTNYNPSNLQLINMVNYLNQTYAATWPGYAGPNNGGVAIPLQFVLAQRDTSCQATTGIIRVDGSSLSGYTTHGMAHSSANGASEVAVKNLSRWDNSRYYNIWIVNKIDGQDGFNSTSSFVAGFAWFPGASADVDGTVMLAYSANANSKTLPHEIGHAFALHHTFNGDNGGTSCPTNANCSNDGDEVCDTDPHIRSLFTCPVGTNPCTNNPYGTVVNNIMDYSSCPDRFTQGQSNRMIAALRTSSRSSLISSLGTNPPGNDPIAATCNPPGIVINTNNKGPRRINIFDNALTYMNVNSSGYTGDNNQFYIDNTCKHLVALVAGNTYTFEVGTGGGTQNVKVFVDYNNDGDFQTAEEIYTHTGTQATETHSFQYTVPTVTTVSNLVSCTPLRMRIIADVNNNITSCGILNDGQAEDYTIVINGGGPAAGSVTMSLTQGSNPSCFNAPLSFTATPGPGITNATYQWMVNGTNTGITSATYNSSTLVNGDVVSVKMKFIGACGFDSTVSNAITVQRAATIPAGVSIALSNGINPGCAGQTLNFTATAVNGGSAPVYQWKVNGVNSGGATSSNSLSGIFNNNDVITVDITSNSSCASPTTATSNSITVVHQMLTADISITADDTAVCAGRPVNFSATMTDGGTNPQYQWYVNNVPVSGAIFDTFSSISLSNNDMVYAVFTSNDACVSNASDTSNILTMGISPVDTPSVNVAITQGSNPGCLDSLIEFTATVSDHGSNPTYKWFVNNVLVATGLTFGSTTLQDGDLVSFSSTATDNGCYTTQTALYQTTVQLSVAPSIPVISLIGNNLVCNTQYNVQWYGPNGLIPGANNNTYTPDTVGFYYAIADNNGCKTRSNTLLVSVVTGMNTYDISQLKLYPNPTKNILNFDWGTQPANVTVIVYNSVGQGLVFEKVNNQTHKTLDLSHLLTGTYYILIMDNNGDKATIPVLIQRD